MTRSQCLSDYLLSVQVLMCEFLFSQVNRVLPQWLAEPDVIHRDIKSNLVPVSEVSGLSAHLQKKLQNNGIQHLFPGDHTACVSSNSVIMLSYLLS